MKQPKVYQNGNLTPLSPRQLKGAEKRFNEASLNVELESEIRDGDNVHIIKGLHTSRKDYITFFNEEFYVFPIPELSKSSVSTKVENRYRPKVVVRKVNEMEFDPRLFNPMMSNTPIDTILSFESGLMPACNYVVCGDPGVGKTTSLLYFATEVKKHNPHLKIGFLSGEMRPKEIRKYTDRFPQFGEIQTLFFSDYVNGIEDENENFIEDVNMRYVIEDFVQEGWDLLIVDSLAECIEHVKDSEGWATKKCEKWFIRLMVKNNEGHNKENKLTSFLATQQMNKGGEFVGSNGWKHNTSGFIYIRFVNKMRGDVIVEIDKNREGNQNDHVYYNLKKSEKGAIWFDDEKLKAENMAHNRVEEEKERLSEEKNTFDKLFTSHKNAETVESEEVDLLDVVES
jgi:KaiC/GvpD/RAD55 family RecA-like ATPase